MRLWKKPVRNWQPNGIARAANAGSSREEILREALMSLVRIGRADRFGVWLAADALENEKPERVYRGIVWDAELETPPKEWMQLTPQSPLPRDLLLNGKSVAQEVAGAANGPLLGPLAGLNCVLWVPVQRSGRLYGILLAGTRSSSKILPREQMEAIAAELALVRGLECESRRLQQIENDLEFSRGICAKLAEDNTPEELLTAIAKSCTGKDTSGQPLALFAAIGRCKEKSRDPKVAGKAVEFPWASGMPEWRGLLTREVMVEVWQGAMDAGQAKGSEVQAPGSKGAKVRSVAMPLLAGDRTLGVLLAVIGPGGASLANLERLELRATLASTVLAALHRKHQDFRREAELQSLLEANHEPLIVVSGDGKILRKNRPAGELLGESPLGGATGHFFARFALADRLEVQSWFNAQASRGRSDREADGSLPEMLEAELDGEKRVALHAVGMADEGSLLLAVNPPVSNRAEDSGREANELLTLVEWLDQGVILFDAREQIRILNARFAQLAGLSPSETGKINSLEGLIARLAPHTAEPELFAGRWRELASAGTGGVREEVHLLRPVSRVLERVSRPVLDGQGKTLGRIEIYRDLTAQRIFQARLLQTERMAALGQMVSGVAHELSNPLTSIAGYAQRLLKRQGELSHAEEVHRIFAEAERASAILRRLLLSARGAPPERQAIALNRLVQRTVELQRFSLAAEKINIDMDLDPLLPPVLGNAGQLQQVLMNLMGNARQAMEERGSGGTIRLKTERVAGNRVRLEVSDTGPGIPESNLSHIFDPFFTTKPAGAGTGLGLPIVLSIIREHSGQVYVQSPPGKGATFVIEIPASAAASELKQRASKSTAKAISFPPGGRATRGERLPTKNGRRALVVEDEPTVAQLIADVLGDEGFQVEILPDGRNAAERAASARFELIVCDMKMPGLNGQHFYDSLAIAGNPVKNRFLFVTGDVLAAHTREFLERNRLPYLAKPFRVEELLEKVQRVLAEAEHVEEASTERKSVATKG
jgi:signal transduction histidine kinase/ActR/RegA family two-component response regulator